MSGVRIPALGYPIFNRPEHQPHATPTTPFPPIYYRHLLIFAQLQTPPRTISHIMDKDPKDFEFNGDVEWFLRDPTLSNSPKSPSHQPPLPHLTTTISNSNDNVTSKTKPSIGTIDEHQVLPLNDPHKHTEPHHEPPRRRSHSLSRSSSISSQADSSGLLSKIKSKFHKLPPVSPVIPLTNGLIFKDSFKLNKTISNDSRDSHRLSRTTSQLDDPLTNHSTNQSGSTDSQDPKLDEYVKFYSQKSISGPSSRKGSIDQLCLVNAAKPQPEELSGSSKLTSFLRRRLTSAASPANLPTVSAATEFNRRSNTGMHEDGSIITSWLPLNLQALSTQSSSTSELQPVLPEFQNLKPLKRVAFHSSTFLIDPPQQIPSRSPRKGNVEVLDDGTLKIGQLTDEDKKAIEKLNMGQGGGIVVGGTGALHYLKKSKDAKEEEEDIQQPPEQDEASSQTQEDVDTSKQVAKDHPNSSAYVIDKPMTHSKKSYTVPVEKMALDLMYTRCCHLREILPIPAILKQIPKDSMAPLPLLQLRNPHPTMIEIQTFADFIRIAPILCVSLDGVNLSFEQFKILLSAMSAKKQLGKLSLRNTPIDADGWSLLCWFLSRNTVLSKLDITQCPQLIVNNFKKKKKPEKPDEITRMTCNKENRTDMDWKLFTATLIARGGIEELILTGCCIIDIEVFENLVQRAIGIKTTRLGLAYNNLTPKHIQIVMEHFFFKPFVKGLDLGFNDLSGAAYLKVLTEFQKTPDFEEKLSKSEVGFLSLNSTNLRFGEEVKSIIEFLIKLPKLKYLDLSNSAKLFVSFEEGVSDEAVIDWMVSRLPLFPSLIRLHLENDKLSGKSIISIANVLPFCKNLGYFSLSGNEIDTISAASLVQAIKNSKRLCKLEADFDIVPSYFKDRIGLYSMRNMENSIYHKDEEEKDDRNPNILTDQLNEILELKSKGELDLKSQVVQDFILKAISIQTELKKSVNVLNNLQLKKELSLEGKETLFRLIFIDSAINKAIKLIDDKFESNDIKNGYDLAERPTEEDETNLATDTSEVIESDRTQFPKGLSKSSSKTSLNHLDKEEGNVHKISSQINLQASGLEDLSGEDIRKKIASINLDDLPNVISFVRHLKDRGVDLSTLFSEIKRKSDEDDEAIDISYITDKLRKLKTKQETDANKPVDADKESSEEKTSENDKNDSTGATATPMSMVDSKLLDSHAGKEMNELYDEMLNNINLK